MRKLFIKKRYIEIVGDFTTWSIDLTLWNVFSIGKFTRENVSDWLAANYLRRIRFKEDWPVDFHAVCGGQDIPWATEAARLQWTKLYPQLRHNHENTDSR